MPDFFALLGDSSNGQTPQQCIWVVKIAPACVAYFSDWGVFCRANRLRAVQQPAAEKAAVWDGGQCAGERAAAGSSWSWWDCCWFERGSQLQQRSGGSSSNSSKPQHLQARSLQAPWSWTCSSCPVSMLLLAAVARAALAARSSRRSRGGARVSVRWKMQSSGHCCACLGRIYWSPCLCFS